jgi:hypothetical protein
MDPRNELSLLCEKIKQHIPSNQIKPDATEPFTHFLQSLSEKGVSAHEIECVRRSYNYFNHILGHVNTPKEPNSIPKIPNFVAERSAPEVKPQIKPEVKPEIKPEIKPEVTEPVSEWSDTEMLFLLIDLFKKEEQRKAITALKALSLHIVNTIPKLDLSWTDAPLKPKDPTTLLGRLNYQVEVAEEVDKKIPTDKIKEFEKIKELIIEVMQLAAQKGGDSTIKEQLRKEQEERAQKKVEQIVPDSIKSKQEEVIQKVTEFLDSI